MKMELVVAGATGAGAGAAEDEEKSNKSSMADDAGAAGLAGATDEPNPPNPPKPLLAGAAAGWVGAAAVGLESKKLPPPRPPNADDCCGGGDLLLDIPLMPPRPEKAELEALLGLEMLEKLRLLKASFILLTADGGADCCVICGAAATVGECRDPKEFV